MKKIAAIVLAGALVSGLTACSLLDLAKRPTEGATSQPPSAPTEPTDQPTPPADQGSGGASGGVEAAPSDPNERITKLESIVRAYLDEQEYIYEHDDANDMFDLGFNINTEFKTVSMSIYVYDDLVTVRTYPDDFNVPEATRDRVAVYLTLVNDYNSYSHLMMDYEDGSVYSRFAIYVEKVLPTVAEIDVLVGTSIQIFEEYGDGLRKVALEQEADPHEVFDAIEL